MAAFVILGLWFPIPQPASESWLHRGHPSSFFLLSTFVGILLCLAFGAIQALIGGTRVLFGAPSYVVLGAAAILSVLTWRRMSSRARPNGACLLATGGFFGYLIGRSLFSPVVYLAWPDFFSLLGASIVYLLTVYVLTSSNQRLGILGFLLAMACVQLGVGVAQFERGDDYMLLSVFQRVAAYRGRASGLYICPNHLAGYLEIVGSLALSAALWARCRAWVKLLFGYLALVCLAGLLLTASRGGFLGATAGLATLSFLSLRRAREVWPQLYPRLRIGVAAAALLLLGATAFAVLQSRVLKDRAGSLFDVNDVRVTQLWPAGIKQFRSQSVMGTGSGTHLYYGRLFREPQMQLDPVHVHNDYLELLAEYGLIGAMGLAVFVGAHLRWGLRTLRLYLEWHEGRASNALSTGAALNIGALAAAAALLTHSLLDFNLHIPANALLMAWVFGLLANPGRSAANLSGTEDQTRRGDFWGRLALPVLGVWILAAVVPKIPGEYFGEEARKALRDKRTTDALALSLRGVQHEQRNPMLFLCLGEAQTLLAERAADPRVRESFFKAAVDAYLKGIGLFPQDVNLLLRAGKALTLLGRYDEAEAIFQQAWRWDPNGELTKKYYDIYLQTRRDKLPGGEKPAPAP